MKYPASNKPIITARLIVKVIYSSTLRSILFGLPSRISMVILFNKFPCDIYIVRGIKDNIFKLTGIKEKCNTTLFGE
jgi:hypothetical protein